ncbi:MAG: DPP IV N-terminal domain-containing protein, partial [bacterium]
MVQSVLAACSQQQKDNKNQSREVKQYTIAQFYENLGIYGGSFSPDETKLLVSSNKTGIFNAYALPLDGSEMIPLTQSKEESVFAISYFPQDERILYSSDKGGNEINHIYMQNPDGQVTDLTPGENAKASFMGWARDEQSFFFNSNQRDPRYFDLYEMTLHDFSPALVYQNDEGMDVGAISKDKQYLALVKSITTSNNEMYLYDVRTKKLKHISKHEGDASYSPQFFDLAGEYLYYLTNEGDEFTYLVRYHLEKETKEKVWETNWDIWYAYQSYNEKYRVIGVNEDASTRVYLFDIASGNPLDFPEIEGGGITSVNISKSEKLMRLTVASSASPNNLYVYNLETKELNKLTNTLNPEIDAEDLVFGKVVRYQSFDGTEIPAIYSQPHQASADNKVPAL